MQQQEKPLSVCRAASVRTLTHKLVLRTDPTDPDHDSELYDLQKDPQESQNRYDDAAYKEVQFELKEKLFLWYMQTSDVTPWTLDSRNGGYKPPGQSSKAFDVLMDTLEGNNETVYFESH